VSPDIYEHQSVVWINQKRSVPLVISVFAAFMFCEIIIYLKGEVDELTVTTAENTSVELTVKE
jgi:hypothetical protein